MLFTLFVGPFGPFAPDLASTPLGWDPFWRWDVWRSAFLCVLTVAGFPGCYIYMVIALTLHFILGWLASGFQGCCTHLIFVIIVCLLLLCLSAAGFYGCNDTPL